MSRWIKILSSEAETAEFATEMAKWLQTDGALADFKIFLRGNLGAGKTAFSRFFIQAFGIKGAIKSPTYTLIEQYEFPGGTILHTDLYRLASPMEIYDLGLLEEAGVWLVEWPEKGEGVLPAPDLALELDRQGETLTITLEAKSDNGQRLLRELNTES